jgi:hypothetical protein
MKKEPVVYDSYILDTCKIASSGKYVAGAITFKGRKRIEILQWKQQMFDSQTEADAFVKRHFEELGFFAEPTNEIDIYRLNPSR